MRGFVAPTDFGWYQHFLAHPSPEVNFWRPGGRTLSALGPGEPLFFKLKAPRSAIAGFGLFARFERLPVWLAWDVYGASNGVATLEALLARIGRLTTDRRSVALDHEIGCISLVDPVFLPPDEWIEVPADWQPTIVSGKGYDLTHGEGRRIWHECLERAPAVDWVVEATEAARFGRPVTITPRLGQHSFRLAVLEAYGGACAVTTEHSLPVLDAAHIRPYAAGGAHAVSNGLPLRRDLHRLFDLGYVTVRPDLRFAVSDELRDRFANGKTYYALAGRPIALPADPRSAPDPDALGWHAAEVFRG